VAVTAARFKMFAGGEKVVVGVSGGPDSVCLLHCLSRLQAGLGLIVAHVDHGMNEASEAIAADVSRWAASEGFDVHVARASGLEGPNLHARARAFRYSFFETIKRDNGASLIATGHTLDDRSETLVQRLVHGAGTSTLAGVRANDGIRVRPLIELRRQETRAYCDELGLAYVTDPANDDPRFERAFVRHELLPLIEQRWGEGAVKAIARSAQRLDEDGSALDELAAKILPTTVEVTDEGRISIDLPTLMTLPRALRRRLLEASIPEHRDRSAGIDEVLEALDRTDRKPDASFDLGGPVVVTIGSSAVVISTGAESK
jgi:tRNA(Ile)-lysidine synthase